MQKMALLSDVKAFLRYALKMAVFAVQATGR
jgi:hypothetical protein